MKTEPQTVRLLEPLEGTYCKLKAGEIVKIQVMPPMKQDKGVKLWRVERETWINRLTISNVMGGVPDHSLIFEEPNQ